MKRGAVLLLALDCVAAYAQATPPASLSLLQALKSTLEHHPLIHVQEQQVQFSRGALLRASSQFDPVLQSAIDHSRLYRPLTEIESAVFDASSTLANLTNLNLGVTRQFRSGITAGPMLDISRTTDTVLAPLGVNQSQLVFQVNLPLLRGRGRNVVAAQETAAGIDVEASLLDLNQSISDLLSNTAAAYWNAVAAMRSFGVYSEAEERGRVYVETVRALIDADRLPRNEISQVQANLATRAAVRAAAQQQFSEARQRLAVAIGLRADQLLTAPNPSDALPTGEQRQIPTGGDRMLQVFIDEALTMRADLLALRKRHDSATALQGAARNQTRPQLDLRLSTGYSGLGEGKGPDRYFSAPFLGIRGADLVGEIRYQFPVGHRAGVAALMQADSALRQTDYRIEEATRTIASSVIVAVDGLRNAAEQLQQARQSVAFSETALENEREKLRLGVGSLIDVLTVEERLTNVRIFEVQTELAFALALTRLRSATGTIVAPDKAVQGIDQSVFLTLPVPRTGRP